MPAQYLGAQPDSQRRTSRPTQALQLPSNLWCARQQIQAQAAVCRAAPSPAEHGSSGRRPAAATAAAPAAAAAVDGQPRAANRNVIPFLARS